ncbi:MAG: imidazole glycerol phosphate synthase subunit HisH [bacterium]|nr:imidazole glycerol phosphate synthase subunit HisH [bacterium]
MRSLEVTVVRTGAANLASVLAAFGRQGCPVRLTQDPDAVRAADRVVLPGVGSFTPVAQALRDQKLDRALIERINKDRPTLGICLGLQLFAAASEESGDVKGLGVISSEVRRFPNTVVVPQLGWNTVTVEPGCTLIESGAAYFANSYRLTSAGNGWKVAWSDHGGEFIAAVEHGAVLGCQFHPELSGDWGADVLKRWLELSAEVTPC